MAEARPGLYASVKGLLGTSLTLLQTRIQLLATELEEERQRVLALLLWGAVAVLGLGAGLLFLATMALVIPSAVAGADFAAGGAFTQTLSVGLSVLLIAVYGLGMLFSLRTHKELFASAGHEEAHEAPWPIMNARFLSDSQSR